ncbi:MAG: DUF1549 domain-containing protein, partial [Planctomycetaceae bacterium]|nr:DUF1549 domain-containing protein [Planctomycetaceae bacterium]
MKLSRPVSVVVTLLLLLVSIAVAETPDEPLITADDRSHWAFQPVVRPELPQVTAVEWCRNPADRFVLAQLEERGLRPMPEADRRTLLRRVTYDLTGLPPTPGEITAFLNDAVPGAYERVVDRLLASPHYGERWGQHWLDLARFAESDGFEHDKVRPNAWRYRDWVIRALNADIPYDVFVQLQIAGDELRPANRDAAIATGFLLCGPDMPDINLQQERRHSFLNDMTSTVGSVFLGLQFQCAACHDHKYDPISQFDFYRLRAYFDPADIFSEKPIPTPEEQAALNAFRQNRAQREQTIQSELDRLQSDASSETNERIQSLEQQLDELKKEKEPRVTYGRVVSASNTAIEPSRLWIRGDFRRPGPELVPATLRVLETTGRSDAVGQTRSDLAAWLVSADHPLTSRVMVNRIWQHHFGRGIVASSSDFGVMGDWPTHPALLDWLAAEFVEQGWSLKAMHRLLVTSSTYRTMSSPELTGAVIWEQLVEQDPDNELLGRMRLRRLEGEAIRDAMLSAAGMLNSTEEGPGISPPLPQEVTSTLLKNQWPVTDNQSDHHRRSVYLFVRRNLPYPLFAAFDRPDTNRSCPRRNETTIAPQALHLLNSEAVYECAK